jgi:hypothetical protein
MGGMGADFKTVSSIHDVTPSGKNAIRLQIGVVLNRDLSVASQNAITAPIAKRRDSRAPAGKAGQNPRLGRPG